ncbi:MAG TPA: ATP-binding protein [Anaerolineales bacterium]|nr:ATP-binding protein [Anaerolineales bacterium]
MKSLYPFTAIVGQERMKTALILNAINPRVGGVLIRGERGTGKSTASRAMAALLPELTVFAE